MPHLIKEVTPLPNFILQVHFRGGVTKQYDVKPFIDEIPIYHHFLVDENQFSNVQVAEDGESVIWNEYLDCGAEEIWRNGKTHKTPFDMLLSFADAAAMWKIDESTLRKAVINKRLVEGVDCMKFGKQWIVTPKAMIKVFGTMPDHEFEYDPKYGGK